MLKRIKELLLSNYGRYYGWFIELDGVVLGELIDYKFIDMFWDSYFVNIFNKDNASILQNESNWNECKFQYRNKIINKYAKNAFPGGLIKDFCNKVTDRMDMRALYILPENRLEERFINIVSFFIKPKNVT
jgi:hypothetical protein